MLRADPEVRTSVIQRDQRNRVRSAIARYALLGLSLAQTASSRDSPGGKSVIEKNDESGRNECDLCSCHFRPSVPALVECRGHSLHARVQEPT